MLMGYKSIVLSRGSTSECFFSYFLTDSNFIEKPGSQSHGERKKRKQMIRVGEIEDVAIC